jgi:hypothetical protein
MYDLDRKIRPVGVRYREIIRQWRGVLGGEVSSSEGEPMTGAAIA